MRPRIRLVRKGGPAGFHYSVVADGKTIAANLTLRDANRKQKEILRVHNRSVSHRSDISSSGGGAE